MLACPSSHCHADVTFDRHLVNIWSAAGHQPAVGPISCLISIWSACCHQLTRDPAGKLQSGLQRLLTSVQCQHIRWDISLLDLLDCSSSILNVLWFRVFSSLSHSSDGNTSLFNGGGSTSYVPQAIEEHAGYGTVVWPDSFSEKLAEGAGLQQIFCCLTTSTARALLLLADAGFRIWFHVPNARCCFLVLEYPGKGIVYLRDLLRQLDVLPR